MFSGPCDHAARARLGPTHDSACRGQASIPRVAGPSSRIVELVRRVIVTTQVAAPPERVWRALTIPAEVERWDGVSPYDVPEGYPAVGQHARWLSTSGPLRLVLHDRILVVDPTTRFASSIDVGFVHVEEEYRLDASGQGTELVSDNEVRSRIPGLGWLAERLTKANVAMSMDRLKAFCEREE